MQCNIAGLAHNGGKSFLGLQEVMGSLYKEFAGTCTDGILE